MPIYVYECSKCKRTIEVKQSIKDAPLTDCECGAKGSLSKVIQPTAVLFKGSGFYVTDYANKASSTAAPACSAQTDSPKCESCPNAAKH